MSVIDRLLSPWRRRRESARRSAPRRTFKPGCERLPDRIAPSVTSLSTSLASKPMTGPAISHGSLLPGIEIYNQSQGSALGLARSPAAANAVTSPALPTMQCIVWIERHFGLVGQAATAAGAGPLLQRNGFRQVLTGFPGEIIVMQPGFGHGVDPSAGHIGIVMSIQPQRNQQGTISSYILVVRGANQGNNGVPVADPIASNVSDLLFTNVTPAQLQQASFWVKP